MQDDALNFDSEIRSILGRRMQENMRDNPQDDPSSPDFMPKYTAWYEKARFDIRRSVYQDTLADLASIGVAGITRKSIDPMKVTGEDRQNDTFGEYSVDPGSPAHEFAVIRQNLYETGRPMPYWDEWTKNAPSKVGASILGGFINANMAWESGARSIGEWIGRTGHEIALSDSDVAKALDVSENELLDAVAVVESQGRNPSLSDPSSLRALAVPGRGVSQKQRELYDKYQRIKGSFIDQGSRETGSTYAKVARAIASPFLSLTGTKSLRDWAIGSDVDNPRDVREVIGRAQGGALVKTGEMAGSAMGIMPYSIPAMVTKSPTIAAAMTSPFYAMGHSDAWNNRMSIYREQLAHARAHNLPDPARPSIRDLNAQSRIAGLIEFGSEYTIDNLQKALPGLMDSIASRIPKATASSLASAKRYGDELLQSFSRLHGVIGKAKIPALAALGGVTEGLEEAIPELAKEVTDPFYIPEGYENDFFSESTAENVGTGFISGFLMTGTAIGGKLAFGDRRRKSTARKAAAFLGDVLEKKANRLATDRLVQNSARAHGATMALHQVEELGSGAREAMFVDKDVAEATVTEDVRQRMDAVGVETKPIGMVGNLLVYATAQNASKVRDAIAAGTTEQLTGNPTLKDPNLPAVGAIVVRNRDKRIVEVVPFSSSDAAKDAIPAIQHRAAMSGGTAETVSGDMLSSLSEAMDHQLEADAAVRSIASPIGRQTVVRKERGIAALRSDVGIDASGSKAKPKDAGGNGSDLFQSPLLNESETNGATNDQVEVEVVLDEVPTERLSEDERRITNVGNVTPTVVDAKVRFTITDPNGKTRVIEKAPRAQGAYLSQSSPDGVFLIRDNGTAFTARNALAVLLHELRHSLVGRSKSGAAYLARLLYLDPVLALNGGLQYLESITPEEFLERDSNGNVHRIDELDMIGRYAAMYMAAESVLSDPSATQQEREQAQADRTKAELLAEESAAMAAELSTGQTLTKAVEFETVWKDTQDRSIRKFVGWMAHKLAKNGWAGPWARQALYEIQQRMQGVKDSELQIHQQLQAEIERKYRSDIDEWRSMSTAMESDRGPLSALQQAMRTERGVGGSGGPAEEVQGQAAAAPSPSEIPAQVSLEPKTEEGVQSEVAKVETVSKTLADFSKADPTSQAKMLSEAISALVSVIPTLASTTASIAGVPGTRTAQRTPSSPALQAPAPTEIAGQAAAQTAAPMQTQEPQPQAMNEGERRIMLEESGREPGLMSLREPRKVEFYSALGRGIDQIETESMSPSAWRQRVKGLVNKGTVKQDEVDWTGLDDFLALPREGKMTKNEITAFLNAPGPLVQDAEQTGSDGEEVRRAIFDYEEAVMEATRIFQRSKWPKELRDALAVMEQNAYRRTQSDELTSAQQVLNRFSDEYGIDLFDTFVEAQFELSGEEPQYEEYTLDGGTNYRELVLTVPNQLTSGNPDVASYESSHWPGVENPVAHIRMKDRRGQDNAKVLFVEEIQSDWAQQGRKKGFAQADEAIVISSLPGFEKQENKLTTVYKYDDRGRSRTIAYVLNTGSGWQSTLEAIGGETSREQLPYAIGTFPTRKKAEEFTEQFVATRKSNGQIDEFYPTSSMSGGSIGVPRAPFVENTDGWLNLSLKRVIMDAINGGYDRVAFVNGLQSAERYDLSKKVDSIVYRKTADGTYDLEAIKDSSVLVTKTSQSESQLEELVGKDVAQRIVNGSGERVSDYPNGYMELSGVDLAVGGEGMKSFYDKIVPSAVNKILKRIDGGKATIVDAGTGQPQIGFAVTDEMRARVQEAGGMPMFSLRRDISENWRTTSKATDDGELTTVYQGNPDGFMQFDAQRMGSTPRPVSIGAATSSATVDGMWFTDRRDNAIGAAGIRNLNMMPHVARLLNAGTKRLARSLPLGVLNRFADKSGTSLSDYNVSAESLSEFMSNDGTGYEDVVKGHARYLSEMFGNDPVAVSAIDQVFNSRDIVFRASELAGSRGGVSVAAHLNLANPLITSFEEGPLRRSDNGQLDRDSEPFILQADRAIQRMRDDGHDGLIMTMPDGERRYFIRNPSQVQPLGMGRDRLEASLYSMRMTSGGLENATAVARSKKWQTQREFKQEIQRLVRKEAEANGIDLRDGSDAAIEHAVRVGVSDARIALAENKNAVGWYDVKTRVAMAIMSLVHPELRTDPNARFAFTYALAVTSNGIEVSRNFKLANTVYKQYKQTGIMPTNVGEGTAGKTINKHLHEFNVLSKQFGIDDFRSMMMTKFTVEQMAKLNPELRPDGEESDVVVNGSSILGPKIGNGFFANLYGRFDALTMDRWLIRTWARWTGDLVNVNENLVKQSRARFKSQVASLSQSDADKVRSLVGFKVTQSDESAMRLSAKLSDKKIREQFQSGALDELRRAANRLDHVLDGQKETPDDGAERKLIRHVFLRILSEIQTDPKYAGLTMADLQAVLWYAEKRLYEKTKTNDNQKQGYEDDEAPDYANAAKGEALASGIPEASITDAERSEDDGTGAARRDGVESVIGDAARFIPGSEGFTPAERKRFAGKVIARLAFRKRIEGTSGWGYRDEAIAKKSSRRSRVLGSFGSVTVGTVWKPGKWMKDAYGAHDFVVPEFLELEPSTSNAAVFTSAISAARRSQGKLGEAVYVYPESEYIGMRMFLSDDGMAGFAIKPDGDLVSVFNNISETESVRKSRGRAAMEAAVDAGAIKLDCFDTMLPPFYASHGFVVASRLKWDETQAPQNWDKSSAGFGLYNNGEPDVVFMVKANSTAQTAHSGEYASDYSEAVERQANAVREMADGRFQPNDAIPAMFSMRRGAAGIRDEAFLRYVDKFDELLRYTRIAQARGINMIGVANPYVGARLLQGVLGDRQMRAEQQYANLLRRMFVSGVTVAEMDRFLTAQHARERNDYVRGINPAFPDGGSGMTDLDADNIIAAAVNSGRFAMLDGYANEWRAFLQNGLTDRLNAGLITRDMYDTLNRRYKKYVPLRGAPAQIGDEDFEAWGEPGGSGLSTSGRGMPGAMGRRSAAEGVTSQIAYVHEDSIRRIARNEIGKSFLNLVVGVADRNMAEVIRPRRRAIVGGVVRQMHDQGWMQDRRNFGVYVDAPITINGHDYRAGDLVVIRINNRRLADAMTTPTLELRQFERALREVNNVWRFMTTGMGNPTFAPVNMIRDVGTAMLNNLARNGVIDTYQMMRRYRRAFQRVWADSWINNNPTGSYADFRAAGGDQVYWRGNDLEAKRTDFDALAERVARRDPNDRGLARTLLGWYSGFFAASETAARLAQYEQRIATGASNADAALAARDITVDFAKGGQAKPILNTWYMFLNAGLQGTVNTLSAVARGVTIAPSLFMLGYASAAIARAMGGDDEETGQSNFDNVPEYEKTSNMYFFAPDGSGRHFKVPLPYGYNVFYSAGVRLESAVSGNSSGSDMLAGVMTDALNAFNPIGGSGIKGGTGGVLTSVLPTMVRPLGEIAINRDFAGRMIAPQQYGRYPGPDSSLMFDGTPAAYASTAEMLNRVTGGDAFESGMIDVSPNTLEYLVGYYMSGTGRMINRLYKATLSDDEASINDIPIVRSFIGNAATDTRAISQQYNEIAQSIAPTMRRIDAAQDETIPLDERRSAIADLNPEKVALADALKSTDKALSELRKLLAGTEGAQRTDLLKARRAVQKSLIRRRNELTQRGAELE